MLLKILLLLFFIPFVGTIVIIIIAIKKSLEKKSPEFLEGEKIKMNIKVNKKVWILGVSMV
jgi:hypothetical protein